MIDFTISTNFALHFADAYREIASAESVHCAGISFKPLDDVLYALGCDLVGEFSGIPFALEFLPQRLVELGGLLAQTIIVRCPTGVPLFRRACR